MKELFMLVTLRDLFMVAIGIGVTIGFYFVVTGIHDLAWYMRGRK